MGSIAALKVRFPALAPYLGLMPWEAHLGEEDLEVLARHRGHLAQYRPDLIADFDLRYRDACQSELYLSLLAEAHGPADKALVEFDTELYAYPFVLG